MKINTKFLAVAAASFFVALSANVSAHHSFAIYDIDNKISRSGTLTSIEFVNPHILMELEAVLEDGSIEHWDVESMQPARFDRMGSDREFVHVGDKVTMLGWPVRSGQDEMALSTIVRESDGEQMVIVEEIRQGRARENLPEVTIKRD